MDRKTRWIQRKIRKLNWHQKLILMDWMNAWYSDYKEQSRKELEEEECVHPPFKYDADGNQYVEEEE